MPSFRSVTPALALGLLTAMSPTARAAVLCVDPAGGSCSTTIAEAVALALSGDTIDIAPGVYHEAVTLPEGLDNVVLEAKGAVLDGTGLGGPGLLLLGDGTEVNGLRVQNIDGNGIVVGDDATVIPTGTTFDGVEIVHVNAAGLVLLGADDTRILGSSFISSRDALVNATGGPDGQGSDALTVEKSVFQHGSFVGCLVVAGDQSTVVGSKFSGSAGGDCISIQGEGARIEGNKLASCDDRGIEIDGADAVVVKNKISGAGDDAIDVSGTNFTIVGNKAKFSGAINANSEPCAGGLVSGNKASDTSEDEAGISVGCFLGGGVVVEKNKVARAMDDCFEFAGGGITANGNKASFCGGDSYEAGFYVAASDTVVTGNSAQGASESGFEVGEPNVTLNGNSATDNFGHGFLIYSSVGVLLEGNESSGNVSPGFSVLDGYSVTLTGNSSADSVPYCKDDVASVVVDGGGNSFSLAAPPVCPYDR